MKLHLCAFSSAFLLFLAFSIASADVSGNPAADGWTLGGHALANGVYTSGKANYGFDIFSNVMTISSGSNLHMPDSSWQMGDTVIGVGGAFAGITADQAGWGGISGNAVNYLLNDDITTYGPRLQVKFGTANAAWSYSTAAPSSGNGSDSTGSGGAGALLVRSSSWFHATDPLLSQDTDTTWSGNAGQLMELDKPSHIERVYPDGSRPNPDANVARLIWTYNADLGKPASWEILLNVSLLDRLYPDFGGLTPARGDLAIVTVQDRNGDYTNGMITVVPEPATLSLLSLGALAMLRRRK